MLKNNLRILTSLQVLFALLSFYTLPAQSLLQYDSVYQPLSSYSGRANFTYVKNKKDEIVKQGSFKFTSEDTDSIPCQNLFTYHTWDGNYNENRKDGKWTYQFESHLVDIKEVKSTGVEYDVHSKTSNLSAGYRNGMPEGLWDFTSYENPASSSKELVERIEVVFNEDGLLQGNFAYANHVDTDSSIVVSGQIENGLMTGTWRLRYHENGNTINEKREYNNGVLLQLNISGGKEEVNLEFPMSETLRQALPSANEAVLLNRPVSLYFSDGYPARSVYMKVQKTGNNHLRSIVKKLMQYDPAVLENRGLPFGANRAFYPLTAEEKQARELWLSEWKKYRLTVENLHETLFTQLHHTNDSALTFIASWLNRQDSLMSFMKGWENIMYKQETEFHFREGLLADYAQTLLGADTVGEDNNLHIISYEVPEVAQGNFLRYVSQNLKSRNLVADSLGTNLRTRIDFLVNVENMRQLNDTLHKAIAVIDSMYAKSSLPGNKALFASYHDNFIEGLFEEDYQQFISEDEEFENREEIGRELQLKLEVVQEVYAVAVDVVKNHRIIDSLYTEYKFDPFTYSDNIPSRIKSRLYELVAVDMYKELLEKSASTEDPVQSLHFLNQLKMVQERMVFLFDKDTKRLERKLNRTDDLEEKLSLIKNA